MEGLGQNGNGWRVEQRTRTREKDGMEQREGGKGGKEKDDGGRKGARAEMVAKRRAFILISRVCGILLLLRTES